LTLLTTGVDSFPSSTRRVADGKKHLTCFIFRSFDLTIAKRTGIGTRLLIVSVPKEKTSEIGCRFYEANESACRRVDKSGLCEAFFEGFPCWHRAAFLLLKIYFGETSEIQSTKIKSAPLMQQLSTKVDTFG
jgi:hypothetical protein